MGEFGWVWLLLGVGRGFDLKGEGVLILEGVLKGRRGGRGWGRALREGVRDWEGEDRWFVWGFERTLTFRAKNSSLRSKLTSSSISLPGRA